MTRRDICGLPRAIVARWIRACDRLLWPIVADLYRAGEVDASVRLARFLLAEDPR